MSWQVRALPDRPDVGHVDELVLHTPAMRTREDVEGLCREAGVRLEDGARPLVFGKASLERRTADRPVRRRMTEPLVALLHKRAELREVYAPADIIDQAIRDGV